MRCFAKKTLLKQSSTSFEIELHVLMDITEVIVVDQGLSFLCSVWRCTFRSGIHFSSQILSDTNVAIWLGTNQDELEGTCN
jgi:hypothetical protein